jgi:hypothetical protein
MQPMERSGCSTFVLTAFISFRLFNIFRWCAVEPAGGTLTYLQFSVIKWAKQRPGQNPFDVKFDEAIQI